jgi:aryl-alcohol dehydrogenase-like predicted oxidoreductase
MRMTWPPLTLGTAQLGMPYGIGSASTGIDERTAYEILSVAWSSNVHSFDTARAYGDAERRIGNWMASRGPIKGVKIISKFPVLAESNPVEALNATFEVSRAELGVSFIDYYLAHRAIDLSKPVVRRLREMVADGLIGAFGASIYEQEEGDKLLTIEGLGAIQLPLHLSNMAMHESGFLTRARDCGVKIFARSVFLQGLLIKPLNSVSNRFRRALPTLQELETLATNVNSNRVALALAVVRACPGVGSIVVGTDNAAQLISIVNEAHQNFELSTIRKAVEIGSTMPRDICDPRKWRE